MKVRNTPLPASWLKNDDPGPLAPGGLGAARRRAIPMTSGNSAVTARSSRFRLRNRTSRSSEAYKRRYDLTGRGTRSADPATLPGVAGISTADIEALTGEPDEQVFQAGRGDREAADADPGLDELGADLLRRGVAQHGRRLGLGRQGVGQAETGQHLGRRLGVGGLHRDPGGAGPAKFGQRA